MELAARTQRRSQRARANWRTNGVYISFAAEHRITVMASDLRRILLELALSMGPDGQDGWVRNEGKQRTGTTHGPTAKETCGQTPGHRSMARHVATRSLTASSWTTWRAHTLRTARFTRIITVVCTVFVTVSSRTPSHSFSVFPNKCGRLCFDGVAAIFRPRSFAAVSMFLSCLHQLPAMSARATCFY